MFPETEFHKLARHLMFLIVGDRIYHTTNSREVDKNFIFLFGLNFPLKRAETLEELEERYQKRNSAELQKFKEQHVEALNEKNIRELETALKTKEDLMFFFREICTRYNLSTGYKSSICQFIAQQRAREKRAEEPRGKEHTLKKILTFNCAVVNGRIYPLEDYTSTFFANLDGKNYQIARAVMTVEEAEKAFFDQFALALKKEALLDFEQEKESSKRILELEKEIGSIEVLDGVRKYTHSYEFGEIGFDTSSKLVYWLLRPHYNETSGKSYGEGQSAVTLTLQSKNLGSTVKFAERNDRNSRFDIYSGSNCYGDATSMPPFDSSNKNSIEDRMFMLRTCAQMVNEEKRFYQAPTYSSSDDSGSYY